MSKSILVTGGTGLIGSEIINLLLQKNYKVIALNRTEPSVKHENLQWIKFDILSEEIEKVLESISNIDGVIHTAAYLKFENNYKDVEYSRKVNIEFTDKLFHHLVTLDKEMPVIYFSSLSILQKPLNNVITEGHSIAPNTIYALSKYWGELSLLSYTKDSKIRPVIFRVSSPISQDSDRLHNNVVKVWVDLARAGHKITIFGKGERTQDFVSTEDIANAVLLAIENNKANGIFNIASGTSISMNKLAEEIAGFFNVRFEQRRMDENENDRWNISLKKATNVLGYQPKYSSSTVISNMLNNCFEGRNTK